MLEAENLPILIVDDDPNIIKMIRDILEIARIDAISATSGRQALECLEQNPVRLAILDMQLPDTYGIQLFQQIQMRYPDLPCIFVSGLDQEMEIVLGLELGAEDYITKPFRPRELLTRIHKVLRRQALTPVQTAATAALEPKTDANSLTFGSLSIDAGRRSLSLQGQTVTLTKAEFDLLWLLATHPGQVLTRRQILDRLWPDDLDVSERIIDTHIRHLREKLAADSKSAALIHTLRGVGYSFGSR